MLYIKTIDENSLQNLKLLKGAKLLDNFYLAGGTVCALHLGHRLSFDLDFFTCDKFDGIRLKNNLDALGKLETVFSNENNFIGGLNGTRLSFIYFKPPLIREIENMDGVKIASREDIVAMKIEAISQRGRKRDFIDLYMLMNDMELTIHDALQLYREKYESFDYNEVHVLKSLKYFEDAEKDPLPKMLKEIDWGDVKKFFYSQKYTLEKAFNKDGPDFGMSM